MAVGMMMTMPRMALLLEEHLVFLRRLGPLEPPLLFLRLAAKVVLFLLFDHTELRHATRHIRRFRCHVALAVKRT